VTGGARSYFTVCAMLCGFALGYLLPPWAHLPYAIYDPVARLWLIGRAPGAVPMGYYGQILYGVGGALVCGAIARLVGSRLAARSARAWGLWAAWSLTALGLAAAFCAWNNWP